MLSGPGTPVDRPEQEGAGRSAGSEAHREADAPATGNARHEDTRTQRGWPFPLQCVFQEDKYQQKTAVRERLEQLRRERSCVMQSKRDR